MTGARLRQALAYAARGWPVFPCQAGQKTPATAHGHLRRDHRPGQITAWFTRHPQWNVAIATGAPGPDVLDVDDHGPAGNGYAAFARLTHAGLLDGASAYVRTPSGGLHAYFRGSDSAQRPPARPPPGLPVPRRVRPGPAVPGRRQALPAHPGSGRRRRPGLGHRHHPAGTPAGRSPGPSRAVRPDGDLSHLARWVASQAEGNRNAGLFWAANRALDADPAADLSPLAAAARQAGLGRQGDHPHPRLGPPRRPAPPVGTRLPGRGRRPVMTLPAIPPTGQNPAIPGQRQAARDHVTQLRQDGGTYRSIAAAAALSPATVSALATGRRRAHPATATAVLKVTGRALPRSRVDAGGTRLRLRALHVMGHGSARIARAVGAHPRTIRKLVRGDTTTISAQLRDAITAVYDAWWDKRAPARTRFERGAATAARKRAIAGNWCAAAALDDDLLDTPGYRPGRLETRHRHRHRPRHPPARPPPPGTRP